MRPAKPENNNRIPKSNEHQLVVGIGSQVDPSYRGGLISVAKTPSLSMVMEFGSATLVALHSIWRFESARRCKIITTMNRLAAILQVAKDNGYEVTHHLSLKEFSPYVKTVIHISRKGSDHSVFQWGISSDEEMVTYLQFQSEQRDDKWESDKKEREHFKELISFENN